MTSSSEQLAVMRPAYMSLPSPNITCAEEAEVRKIFQFQAWKIFHNLKIFQGRAGQEGSGQPWPGWSPPGLEQQGEI